MASVDMSPRRNGRLSVDGIAVLRSALYVALFAGLAVYFLIWPIWRSQFLVEIWVTEGWNAYFQDAAISGARLYPEAGSLIVNNYPPLSFYAVGLLGQVVGDNLFAGRLLSFVGLAGIAIEIFLCVRILAGGWAGGLFGAFWFIAIMSHNSSLFVGVNDPQLAGEAIMGAGLAWLLARDAAGKSATPALLIMVIGGFWKHNMIAIPLTAMAWLFLNHGRQAIRPVAISALAVGAGLGICGVLYGHAFFENLLVARDYRVSYIQHNVGHLQWGAAAMLIWIAWAASSRTIAARFTMLHVPIGLCACLLQWTGDAVYGNAEFDLLLALGIATGVTFAEIKLSAFGRRFGAGAAQTAMVAILALRLIASDRQEPALILFDPGFRTQFEASEQAARAEANSVSQIPGDVYCNNKVICRLAGKPFVVDGFKVEQMIATHLVTKAELDEMLKARKITTFNSRKLGMVDVDTSLASALHRAGYFAR
jgi:hypothetical protein